MAVEARTAGGISLLSWICPESHDDPQASARQGYEEIVSVLGESVVLHERIFAPLPTATAVLDGRHDALGSRLSSFSPGPTFVVGASARAGAFSGVHLLAATPTESAPVTHDGTTVGRVVTGQAATFMALSDVGRALPTAPHGDPCSATAATLGAASEILERHGWSFRHVVRTWFFLDDILSSYAAFNRARNRVFDHLHLLADEKALLPASTGIGGASLRGDFCTLDLLALRQSSGDPPRVQRLQNPLQNEAPEYGSAFSRALAVDTDEWRLVFLSGTAAIDRAGASRHLGSFVDQAEHTLDAADALLGTVNTGLRATTQGTVFVKSARDVPALDAVLQRRGLESVPWLVTVADICRQELLFELDATILVPAPRSSR